MHTKHITATADALLRSTGLRVVPWSERSDIARIIRTTFVELQANLVALLKILICKYNIIGRVVSLDCYRYKMNESLCESCSLVTN